MLLANSSGLTPRLPVGYVRYTSPDVAVKVVRTERDHRQPPSLRGEGVRRACRLLLRDQQLFASRPPLVGEHGRWDRHAIDPGTGELATATGCVRGRSLN